MLRRAARRKASSIMSGSVFLYRSVRGLLKQCFDKLIFLMSDVFLSNPHIFCSKESLSHAHATSNIKIRTTMAVTRIKTPIRIIREIRMIDKVMQIYTTKVPITIWQHMMQDLLAQWRSKTCWNKKNVGRTWWIQDRATKGKLNRCKIW